MSKALFTLPRLPRDCLILESCTLESRNSAELLVDYYKLALNLAREQVFTNHFKHKRKRTRVGLSGAVHKWFSSLKELSRVLSCWKGQNICDYHLLLLVMPRSICLWPSNLWVERFHPDWCGLIWFCFSSMLALITSNKWSLSIFLLQRGLLA